MAVTLGPGKTTGGLTTFVSRWRAWTSSSGEMAPPRSGGVGRGGGRPLGSGGAGMFPCWVFEGGGLVVVTGVMRDELHSTQVVLTWFRLFRRLKIALQS